jgi:hypothetical protein
MQVNLMFCGLSSVPLHKASVAIALRRTVSGESIPTGLMDIAILGAQRCLHPVESLSWAETELSFVI